MSGGGVSDDDDVTIWAGRLRSWPTPPTSNEAPDAADPDEATILGRRRAEAPDDRTALTRRRSVPPADVPTPADVPDDETALARRRGEAPAPDPTALGPDRAAHAPSIEAERDHTVLRTRSAATRQSAIGAPVDAARQARVPSADEREIFRPRAVEPVRAVRAAPTPSAPPDPVDVTAAATGRDRRRRRRTIVFVVTCATAMALAVAGIAAILVLPH